MMLIALLFILTAFCFYVLFMRAFFPKRVQKMKDNHQARIIRRRAAVIDHNSMAGKMMQLLESIDIIHTSNNRDTLNSRYLFSKELLAELSGKREAKVYHSIMAGALEKYQLNYYDKTLTPEQKYFISNPDDEKEFGDFYIKEISRCFSENS